MAYKMKGATKNDMKSGGNNCYHLQLGYPVKSGRHS